MAKGYNEGNITNPSNIDGAVGAGQLRQNHYNKKAVIDIKDEMILSQMSGTMAMPKNKGKEVVKHRYLPLLDDANANAGMVGLDTTGVAYAQGNLYGSSRGTGFIAGKLPDLGEESGRVNKVSFSRKEVKGNIVNRGFFFEWSKDEVNFDSDPAMRQYITTEAVRGANQINEDVLAIELINGAGVNYYAGAGATTLDTINGESIPTIKDLIRLDTELDNNKCPRDTKVITGSRMVDTKTVAAARYMFISPDVKMDFMAIKALNGVDDAFIPIEQYQGKAGGSGKYIKTIHGEIGKVGPFRIVVHPKMVRYSDDTDAAVGDKWDAVDTYGADETETTGVEYRNDGEKYEVYPCLVVGSEAFTHIGFEYGAGTKGKFDVVTSTPEELRTKENPYAKTGMTVIEFWNGVLIERPEWVAVYNVCSKY